MQVPHNAFVLVCDGRKSLFFRNDGDGEYPNLIVEEAQERPNPRDIDQKTDTAGGAMGTQMGGGAPNVARGGGGGGPGGDRRALSRGGEVAPS